MKIWTNRASLAELNNFQAYLFVISKNHALNCLKRIASEKALTSHLDLWIYNVQPEETDDDNERYTLVDHAIDQLPKQQKIVYLLSRHESLQYAEIASRLSISPKTVKKYLQISTESNINYIGNNLTVSGLYIILNYF